MKLISLINALTFKILTECFKDAQNHVYVEIKLKGICLENVVLLNNYWIWL